MGVESVGVIIYIKGDKESKFATLKSSFILALKRGRVYIFCVIWKNKIYLILAYFHPSQYSQSLFTIYTHFSTRPVDVLIGSALKACTRRTLLFRHPRNARQFMTKNYYKLLGHSWTPYGSVHVLITRDPTHPHRSHRNYLVPYPILFSSSIFRRFLSL